MDKRQNGKKKKKMGRYKMNQNDIIYMTPNKQVQDYIVLMMALSDLGVMSAITINNFL